jgi:hypothetical protein
MSQGLQQEALTKLLVEKGIFSEEELGDVVRVVDQKMNKS